MNDIKLSELVPEHMRPSLAEQIERDFNREISTELLRQENPDIDGATIELILGMSKNPWDAPVLYHLLKATDSLRNP